MTSESNGTHNGHHKPAGTKTAIAQTAVTEERNVPAPRTLGGARQILVSTTAATAACAAEAVRLLDEAGHRALLLAIDDPRTHTLVAGIALETVAGVLELAQNGLADSLLRGESVSELSLLDLAIQAKLPAVLAPGGLDRVNFGARDTVPPQYGRRKSYSVSPEHTLIRVEVAEGARLGRALAERVNRLSAPAAVCLPLRGISDLDAPGQPFYLIDADMTLFGNLTTHLRHEIVLRDLNANINDPAFARLCTETLLALIPN